jgi:hypothetical protein
MFIHNCCKKKSLMKTYYYVSHATSSLLRTIEMHSVIH